MRLSSLLAPSIRRHHRKEPRWNIRASIDSRYVGQHRPVIISRHIGRTVYGIITLCTFLSELTGSQIWKSMYRSRTGVFDPSTNLGHRQPKTLKVTSLLYKATNFLRCKQSTNFRSAYVIRAASMVRALHQVPRVELPQCMRRHMSRTNAVHRLPHDIVNHKYCCTSMGAGQVR